MRFKPIQLLLLALVSFPAFVHAAPEIKCKTKRNIGWSEYRSWSALLNSEQRCIQGFYKEKINGNKSYLIAYALESAKAKNGGTECVWRWQKIVNPDALSLGLSPPSGAPRVISCMIDDNGKAAKLKHASAHLPAEEEAAHDQGSAE